MNNELWEQWSDCHQSSDQQKRISSAQKAPCTPVGLDRDMGAGVFRGSSGTHTTTLENCTCVDFCRRKLPCKHMYRLAMEFGLIDLSYKSDSKAIITSPKESIGETVKRIEELTEPQQKLLHEIIRTMNSSNPISAAKTSPDLICLLDAHLLNRSDNLPIALNGHKMSELRSLVSSLRASFNGRKKADLVNYLSENYSSKLKSMALAYTAVELSAYIKYKKVNMYLHRKFDDNNVYWDIENDRPADPVPLLETDLPNDDVTDLLIQYGYYHR